MKRFKDLSALKYSFYIRFLSLNDLHAHLILHYFDNLINNLIFQLNLVDSTWNSWFKLINELSMICYCQNSFRRIFGLIVYFLQEKKTKTKKQKWIEREIRVYEKNGCVFSSYCFKIKKNNKNGQEWFYSKFFHKIAWKICYSIFLI